MNLEICKYFPCDVATKTDRNCSEFGICQTFRFYERYGLDYLSLGVGAMMVAPRRDEGEEHKVSVEILGEYFS